MTSQPSPDVADESGAKRVRGLAASLFAAFVAGVAYRAVRDRRMSQEDADRWKKDAIEDFKSSLEELSRP
jgi:hypothetical protein